MVTAESPTLTVHDRYDDASIAEFRERGWWQGGSAAALLDRWAESTPTRRFVSDGVVELDYGTVRERSRGLGAALLRAGVRPGDRVAMQLPNWAEFVVGYLAVARIGAVLVPIMTVYRKAEVGHVLRNSGAVAAITTGEFRGFDHAAMFRELRGECPALATLVIARADAADGELSFDDACATTTDDAELGPHPDPDLPHLVVYTSGTESTAKGCVHTWNTLDFSARGLAHEVFRTRPEDVMFMPSPVAHATGFVVGVLGPLAVGSETHLLDIWEPNEGLRRIEQYGCTASATATPFVRMALDAARTAERDLSSMRFWLCAGAPIPAPLATEFHDAFDGGVLMPLYGCSEVMAATCCHPGDPIERRAGSDGSPALDGIRIKLIGPDGDDVATGEEGEICYWGPGGILGYWREPERTAATIDAAGLAPHRRPGPLRRARLPAGVRPAEGHHHPGRHEHQRGGDRGVRRRAPVGGPGRRRRLSGRAARGEGLRRRRAEAGRDADAGVDHGAAAGAGHRHPEAAGEAAASSTSCR